MNCFCGMTILSVSKIGGYERPVSEYLAADMQARLNQATFFDRQRQYTPGETRSLEDTTRSAQAHAHVAENGSVRSLINATNDFFSRQKTTGTGEVLGQVGSMKSVVRATQNGTARSQPVLGLPNPASAYGGVQVGERMNATTKPVLDYVPPEQSGLGSVLQVVG